MNRLFLGVMAFSPLLGTLVSCGVNNPHYNCFAFGYGTYWDIHLYEGKQSDCDELAAFVNSSSRLFDLTDNGASSKSLRALNSTNDFIELDPMVIEALQKAIAYEEETKGAFSYRLGHLTSAWLDSLQEGKTLPDERRDELLLEASETSVEIEGNKARRIGQGTIDLNALAKGYCCLKIKEKLDALGYKKYLVNGGSSSLLIGKNSSGPTRVHLKYASDKSFLAKDGAVSCSAITEQSYRIDGKTYSHIVNPFNGDAIASYQAVYLYGHDACALDAYSTAAMVSGLEFGKSLEKKGISIAVLNEDSILYETSGFLE